MLNENDVKLENADYGLGEQSIYEAMEVWANEGRTVYFANVSRLEKLLDCMTDYYWEYVHGIRGVVLEDHESDAALVLGTGLHSAAEHLLEMHKRGFSFDLREKHVLDDAIDMAHLAICNEWHFPRDLGPKNHEKHQDFLGYVDDLVAAAAPKLELIDEVWAIETLVWACVPIGDHGEWVCVMGRPDAVVFDDGYAWHFQHKSREKEIDYGEYVDGLSFGGHETVYGWILTQLLAQGAFGEERKSLVYYGSKIGMWLKQAKPNAEPKAMPKGLATAVEKGWVSASANEGGDCAEFVRLKCTDKQYEDMRKMFDNWVEREQKRVEALRSYEERAFQILDCDLDIDKMQLGFLRLARAAYVMAGVNTLTEPDPALPLNTNACKRWGRTCLRLHSTTCGGWDSMDPFDPDSKWTHREPDYIDEARSRYDGLLNLEAAS